MSEDFKRMKQRHEKEIQELQDSCLHKTHSRMPYMWAPGHLGNDVEVCGDCGKILENYNSSISLNPGETH